LRGPAATRPPGVPGLFTCGFHTTCRELHRDPSHLEISERTVRGPGKRGGTDPPGTVSHPVDTATLAFSVAPVFCVRKRGREESARPAQYVLANYSKTTSEQL